MARRIVNRSKIQWTDATWNPVSGCSHVSEGCRNCYAERQFPRIYQKEGRVFTDVRCHPERLELPLRWKKPKRIFVNSMSDLFHEDVPDAFIFKVFEVMANAQFLHGHQFQILTKRPKRMQGLLKVMEADTIEQRKGTRNADGSRNIPMTFAFPFENIWLGVSVEDQQAADERIPLLLDTPAVVRWVSAEPLLGPVDFRGWMGCALCGDWPPERRCMDPSGLPLCSSCSLDVDGPIKTSSRRIEWVVVGGESGPKARPMHPAWARSIRDQCQRAGVPFFFKQWGEWSPILPMGYCRVSRKRWSHESKCIFPNGVLYDPTKPDEWTDSLCITMFKQGKRKAGHLLDGQVHQEYPA